MVSVANLSEETPWLLYSCKICLHKSPSGCHIVARNLALEEQQNVACCILRTAQINDTQPIQSDDFEAEVGELPDRAHVSLLLPTPHDKIPLIIIILPPRGIEIKLMDSVWFPIPADLDQASQWQRLS